MAKEREIILEALILIEKSEEYAEKVTKEILDKYAYLEKRERAFINKIIIGTVERKLTLDYIINQFSTVKVNKQKPVIRCILRMAVYQIMYLDSVPDSAAINEAVKLAKLKKFVNLSGFVNGVLRNISKNKSNISFPDKDKEFIKFLSVFYSCPEWLCEHYISETDKETAEKILKASLLKARLTGRVNLSKISREELLDRLRKSNNEVREIEETQAAFELVNIDALTEIEEFNDGLFVIQDLSSQMLIEGTEIKKGDFIIDVCAAPGGKSLHAADVLCKLNQKTDTDSNGASSGKVLSRDLTEFKIEKIEDNAYRCGFENIETEVFDALLYDESLFEKADVLICDLPCSGLGVIGRKPDIKYRVDKEDLKSLGELQRNILNTVYKYLKKDGILVYSTCTINKGENIQNVKWITENLPFELIDEPKQFIQGVDDSDGFFISRFRKQRE